MHHRLRTAGAPEDVIFDAEAIDSVAKYSSGIPRMINAVCDYALLAGFTLKKRQINLECLKMAINELENNS